jgi:hypothetical protein
MLTTKVLRIGIEYLKQNNERALLKLTKEDLHLFRAQLGMLDPGQ